MDQDERLAAIRLHLATGIGPRLYGALVERFGSAAAAAEADPAALAEVEGLGRARTHAIRQAIDQADPEGELARAASAGAAIVIRGDPDYPKALTYLFDAPPVLGVSDALVLARNADAVLLVVQHRKYPKAISLRAKEVLENAGVNVTGVILNKINMSRDYSHYYYYYASYYADQDRRQRA